MTWAFFVILLLSSGQEQRLEFKGYRSLAVCERVMRWEAEQALQLMKPYRLQGLFTTRCEEVE